jgi:cytochrome P450
MIALFPSAEATDREVDEVLNRFIYNLYARARRPGVASDPLESVITEAGQIDAVLRDPDRFHKNFSLIAMLGHSRFSTNGPQWWERRELTQPTYRRAGSPDNRGAIAAAYADAFAACGSSPRAEAIQRALLAASTKIFLLAFGCAAATDPLLAFFDRARRIIKRLQYYSWLAADAQELSALRADVNSLLEEFGRELERSPELLVLLKKLQSDGQHITKFGALDEFLMNFFAGIETTAATLSFAVDRLGVDKRVRERLIKEVNTDNCPYLDCFLNETMRYFPAIPFVVRQVTADTMIDGTTFRVGQLVMLSIVGAHHDPRYWKYPEIFDCSRAEFLGNSYNRRAFIPFLAGPRMCGGAKLARMELSEGLKAFVRRFNVEREGDEINFDYGLALRPNSWERIKISKES